MRGNTTKGWNESEQDSRRSRQEAPPARVPSPTDKKAAEDGAPKVYKMIDKLAKIGVIHKNKAANLKSGIAVYINKLA